MVGAHYIVKLATLVAFLLPLKLAATYVVLIPLLAYWLWQNRTNLPFLLQRSSAISFPFIAFVAVAALTSTFGIAPWRSLQELAGLVFFSASILLYQEVGRSGRLAIVQALLAGQLIASSYSVLSAFKPEVFPSLFLGKVTQSGQIGLIMVLALALLILSFKQKEFASSRLIALTSVLSMALALLVNLKRGPWAGVLIGSLLLLFKYNRKLVVPLIVVVIIALSIKPVQDRLRASEGDFFIAGGRGVIWEIGAELSTRFPLGVGYNNAKILRKFSPEIPSEHKHFHNNLLNIVVETGWLGLAVALYWLYSILRYAFSEFPNHGRQVFATGIGCAIISWQIAGLVEYNFGDTEILLVVFVLLGLLASIERSPQERPA